MKSRAFLFTWNPAKYPEERWKSLDDLARDGSGDDHWKSGSGRPRVNDWAFAVKLGKKGRGFFARGRITSIRRVKKNEAKALWRVWIHWSEFLDPRDPGSLRAFPRSRREPPQKWDPQSNGTEVKNFPVTELHELWGAHYSRVSGRRQGAPQDVPDGLVKHSFRLRSDVSIVLRLPPDLTTAEADRVGSFVKKLAVGEAPTPKTASTVSARASTPGLGPSAKRPTGRHWAVPRGVKVHGAIKGGASTGTRVGSGVGHVDVGLTLAAGGTASSIRLPAGLVMISKRADVQHGLLVQDAQIDLSPNETTKWVLHMYCANHSRSPADEHSEFEFGPIVDDPALRDLFELLAGREIAADRTEAVQMAVWEITDGEGLTKEMRAQLTRLPRLVRWQGQMGRP